MVSGSRTTTDGVLDSLRGRPMRQTTIQTPNGPRRISAVDPELQDLARMGLMPDAYPEYQEPAFSSNLPRLDERLAGAKLNTQGLESLRGEAMRTGPSTWAELQKRRLGMEQTEAGEELARQQSGAFAQGASRLAAAGGLSAGARERLASGSARGGFEQQQALSRQGMSNRLGVDTTDEQNRLSLLQALPGLEAQASTTQYNTQVSPWLALANREQELRQDRATNRNAFNLQRFGTQADAYGSLKTAQAQRAAVRR